MIDYTITIAGGKKKYPVMKFADSKYDLLGELFLAERSFLKKVKSFLKNDNEKEFSGNVFTLTKDDGEIVVENEVTEKVMSVDRNDFTELLKAYYGEYKKLI